MNTIEFNKFFNYVQDKILLKKAELYDNNTLEEDLNFVFYDNSGEYFTEVENLEVREDVLQDRRVICNILNGGGVQDSSIPIDTYAQVISIELLALDSQREDIMQLFTEFVASYKSKIDNIGNSYIQLNIGDFPKYSDKFQAHGNEKFNMSLTFTIIVAPGAKLSNKFELIINGESVPYSQLVINRTTEVTADNKKAKEIKFFPNTTTMQITVNGLFVGNSAINTLFSDCTKNTNFNNIYELSLVDTTNKNNPITYLTESFYAKDLLFTIAYGSIISWQASFLVAKEA